MTTLRTLIKGADKRRAVFEAIALVIPSGRCTEYNTLWQAAVTSAEEVDTVLAAMSPETLSLLRLEGLRHSEIMLQIMEDSNC